MEGDRDLPRVDAIAKLILNSSLAGTAVDSVAEKGML